MKVVLILLLVGTVIGALLLFRNRQSAHIDLNSGMTEAITSPQPGFISKRTFPPSDLHARITQIPWFTNCGASFTGRLSMNIIQVHSWKEAEQRSAEPAWETATLEAQNQITVWLHMNARPQYQQWNNYVRGHKEKTITPVVAARVIPFQQAHGLTQKIVSSTSWNLLGALMEDSYRETGHPGRFFQELLEVYEAGHYPCGWVGQWPEGKLVVF